MPTGLCTGTLRFAKAFSPRIPPPTLEASLTFLIKLVCDPGMAGHKCRFKVTLGRSILNVSKEFDLFPKNLSRTLNHSRVGGGGGGGGRGAFLTVNLGIFFMYDLTTKLLEPLTFVRAATRRSTPQRAPPAPQQLSTDL